MDLVVFIEVDPVDVVAYNVMPIPCHGTYMMQSTSICIENFTNVSEVKIFVLISLDTLRDKKPHSVPIDIAQPA